jgi:hypothetical protein
MNYSFNQNVLITTANPTVPDLPPVEERLQTLVEAMKTLAELTGGKLNPELEKEAGEQGAISKGDRTEKGFNPTLT